MDNSEVASTTQLDSGDIAAAVDVPDHLESGEPRIINLALAIEALKRGAAATSAATEVPQEALIKKTQEALIEKTQEALKNKTKRLADDTLEYSHVDI